MDGIWDHASPPATRWVPSFPEGAHISVSLAGFPTAQRHGDLWLQGSWGLSLDGDGAGLQPPNGAFVWGGGLGDALPTACILEHPCTSPAE